MAVTIFRHKGPFDSESRQNRALRFIEEYTNDIASSLKLQYPDTKYYSPTCVFFDTTSVTYTGAKAIKEWMLQLFSPFDKIGCEGMSFLVVDESSSDGTKYTVNAEFMMEYYLKGSLEPIAAPRMFVFEIGDSVTEDGFDRLQFTDVKLYWDTDLVKSEIKRRVAPA